MLVFVTMVLCSHTCSRSTFPISEELGEASSYVVEPIKVLREFGLIRTAAPEDIAQARLALLLRPTVHAVAEGPAAARLAGNGPDAVRLALLQHAREHLEARAPKMLRDVLHLDGNAQVGLVGAVEADRLVIGNAPERLRHRLAVREGGEHVAQDRLHRAQHVVLRDEAHLQVELVELARQAVGARVLVAKARRDLEVAVEARHHQQLLVDLRRLRQRVELARMDAGGHEEVARALGAGGGEDRGGELGEARRLHAVPNVAHDPGAGHDVGVQRLAAQVEEAVGKADVLGVVGLAEHGQRQLARLAQRLDLAREQFDLAGRQVGVDGPLVAPSHVAVDADHPLGTHALGRLEGGRVRIGHDLRDAVMVAQVDEQHAAMIAHPMHPARQAGGVACILRTEGGACVRAIAVHGECLITRNLYLPAPCPPACVKSTPHRPAR